MEWLARKLGLRYSGWCILCGWEFNKDHVQRINQRQAVARGDNHLMNRHGTTVENLYGNGKPIKVHPPRSVIRYSK